MTIYALSTGPGISGIAIVRISGPKAGHIIKSLTGEKNSTPKNRNPSKNKQYQHF